MKNGIIILAALLCCSVGANAQFKGNTNGKAIFGKNSSNVYLQNQTISKTTIFRAKTFM